MVCRISEDIATDTNLLKAQREYTQTFLQLVDCGSPEHQTTPTALQRHQARKAKKRRLFESAFFTVTAAIALCFTFIGGYRALSNSDSDTVHMSLVTVTPGENLWTLAKLYGSAGSPTAITVAAIRDANPGLDDKPLAVGQRLLVPTDSLSSPSAMMASARFGQDRRQ